LSDVAKSSVGIIGIEGEHFISDAIKTVRAQSRLVSETIVVDGKSTDNTVSVIR